MSAHSLGDRRLKVLADRGIDLDVFLARDGFEYRRGQRELVKEPFRPFFTNPRPRQTDSVHRLVVPARWANKCTCPDGPNGTGKRTADECDGLCGGLMLMKHPFPGRPDIPPQMRPDEPISADSRVQWHKHGPADPEDPLYLFELLGLEDVHPAEAGPNLAGKPLLTHKRVQDEKTGEVRWVHAELMSYLYGPAVEKHINSGVDSRGRPKDGAKPYNRVTGEGKHMGVDVEGVHKHVAPRGKYQMIGEVARFDIHPWALAMLPAAETVFLVMEGTLKSDSVLSAIRREGRRCSVFGLVSISTWKMDELIEIAGEHLKGKTVLIVPDADWADNWQVEWQALRIRTVLRSCGIDATYIAAPPTEEDCAPGDYRKGIDDYLGVKDSRGRPRHSLGDLVLDNREPPARWRIDAAVSRLPYRKQRRDAVGDALEWLSLFADQRGRVRLTFQALKRRLQKRHASEVVPLLEALVEVGAVTVSGSLQTVQKATGRKGFTLTTWENTPTITVDERYRADRKRSKLLAEDFWQRTAIELLRDKVEDLDRWRRDTEARKAAA